MKRIGIVTILCIVFSLSTTAQVKRVAIVDFDISGTNPKYNGLGKAMADMLITDMKNSVSSSKAIFIERNQINKVLKEQNFQKGANVDKNSTVSFGKVLGVNYLLTGSIFVLDGMCTIDSKLIDTSTGEIVSAESVDGNLSSWLQLKSKLGSQLSQKLALPIQKYKPDATAKISENVLTNYSAAVEATDNSNFDEAQKLLKEIRTEDANFEYSSPLMKHIIEMINATKKFDNKDEAILNEAQLFFDSLKVAYDKAFPLPPVIDANLKKKQIEYDWLHKSTEVQEKRQNLLSKIDPNSRFSAEFPAKYDQMLSSFYYWRLEREKKYYEAGKNIDADYEKKIIEEIDSLTIAFNEKYPKSNYSDDNEKRKEIDDFYYKMANEYKNGDYVKRFPFSDSHSHTYPSRDASETLRKKIELFLDIIQKKMQ